MQEEGEEKKSDKLLCCWMVRIPKIFCRLVSAHFNHKSPPHIPRLRQQSQHDISTLVVFLGLVCFRDPVEGLLHVTSVDSMLQVMSASSQDHSRQESCTKSHVEGRNTINKQPRQHRVLIHHQCESNGEMSHQPQHATTTHRRDHPSTHEHEQQEGRTSQESGVGVQVMKQTKLAKAPGAPKRFKSSYIFFSSWKHKQIREQLRISGNPSQVSSPPWDIR